MKDRKKVRKEIKEQVGEPSCYFCGFSEYVELHHLIPVSWGGLDEKDNLMWLCPNHHKLIHSKICYLKYINGIYILINRHLNNKEIYPIDMDKKEKKQIPKTSKQIAVGNNYLINKGEKLYLPESKIKETEDGWFYIERKEDNKKNFKKGVQ